VSRNEKLKFIRLVESSQMSNSEALARYDVPRSTTVIRQTNIR
jgi:hypothetical protein